MTQEDKSLLLKDLCARLPYGVKVENTSFSEPQTHTLLGRVFDDEFLMLETYKSVGGEDYRRVVDDVHYTGYLESIKPYLRPISSMMQGEWEEMTALIYPYGRVNRNPDNKNELLLWLSAEGNEMPIILMSNVFSWLNAHHFDYRGLIEKGLALEAPENMYK